MKKLVNVTEVSGEGFEKFIGEKLTVFCFNYIYTGTLTGINDSYIQLTDAMVVYETGPFNEKNWKDAQPVSKEWYIMISAVESFGYVKG